MYRAGSASRSPAVAERRLFAITAPNPRKTRNLSPDFRNDPRKQSPDTATYLRTGHAPLIVDPVHLRGRFGLLTRGRVFTKGHRRSAFTEGIYQDDDRVVTGRTGFDGFIDSDLLTQLHDAGAQRVLFAGFATDQCVGRTWRTALKHGFDAYVVTDCTATFSAWLQRRARRRFGARALTLQQANDMLEGTPG